jgi:hypothetical protein
MVEEEVDIFVLFLIIIRCLPSLPRTIERKRCRKKEEEFWRVLYSL